MQGLVNWKALRDLKFASLMRRSPQEKRENAGKKAEGGGVDWDEVANMYNEMTRMEARSTAQAISLLPIGPEDSVLDVGCGPGRLIVPLAKIARSVTGVDAFAQMLSFARQNAQSAGLKNVKFLQKSWLDDDALEAIGKHDVVIASRSVGLGDIEKLNKIAKKYVVLMCFFESSLREIWQGFLQGVANGEAQPHNAGISEQKKSEEARKNDRMFGYNVTFNMLYDMGANPNVHIMQDIYEKEFASREEAYEHFRFAGEIPTDKERIYRANVDKYLTQTASGWRFERRARSYVMWWDVREISQI
ncbi:class I SAM-dependent methyltransferase [Campylobacter rectus]|uniref:class I SAM-dependent methyltransferase n=1 Tax=Campylobacter rectus TaxID=203 RepID=UPI0023F2B930|nr:methyltransferase domain-containing protein [Campylobacter rectus]